MRKAKRWRYYCDYCNKGGSSKWHMEQHEKHCTMNPDRKCRMCRLAEYSDPDKASPSIAEMVAILEDGVTVVVEELGEGHLLNHSRDRAEENLKRLRSVTACPNCIFAAIRQSKWPWIWYAYNFKLEGDKLRQEAYSIINDEEMSRRACEY